MCKVMANGSIFRASSGSLALVTVHDGSDNSRMVISLKWSKGYTQEDVEEASQYFKRLLSEAYERVSVSSLDFHENPARAKEAQAQFLTTGDLPGEAEKV